MKMKNALILALLLALSLSTLFAQLDTAELSSQLDASFEASQLPGLSLGIVTTHGTVYQRSFGYSNIEQEIPFKTTTCLPVGSVTKTLTGMAVVRLIEMGLVSWDSPINDHLPFEIVNPYHQEEPIRLHHLLNHTSSLQDGKNYGQTYLLNSTLFDENDQEGVHEGYLHFIRGHEALSLEAFIQETLTPQGRWYKKKNFLKSAPGEEASYSNINASLAGLIVERLSNQSFETFVEQHIFEPLGIASSFSAEANSACLARLYFPAGDWVPPYRLATYPDGGWVASLEDLARYVQDVVQGYTAKGGILEAESYHTLLPGDEDDRRAFWGMGSTRNIGHTGSDPGVHCELRFHADHPVGIILLTNVNAEDNEALWKQYRAIRTILMEASKEVQ